jgi:phytoene dehydrogenase-like protein
MFLSAFMVVGAPPPRAVVVGGGVGGLYAAAKLAREGVAVTLLEKNSRAAAGGRLACECVTAANGRAYRFETGPSLLLLPSIYRDAFASLGVDPDAHLDLARCNPSYAVHFNDGGPTPLEIGGDAACEAALRTKMDAVEPGAYDTYCHYLGGARANLASGLPIFIKEMFDGASLATLPRFLQSALLGTGAKASPLRDWPLRSHGGQLADLFKAARHRELAAFQDLYVGLAPERAPAVFSLLQAIELPSAGDSDSGVFYPRGGWGTVRDALLAAVEANGVQVRWNTRVEEIVVRDGAVQGVRVVAAAAARGSRGVDTAVRGGDPCVEFCVGAGAVTASPMSTPAVPGSQLESQLLDADCVIVNADLAAAEPQLLPPALRRSEYAEQSEMTSTERLATIGRTVQRAATAVAVALKTAMGAAVPHGAEVAETMAPPPTTATEGLLRAGGWRYSSSTVSFYWCLDRRYAELRHHNVFLAPADAWRGLFDAAEYARWDERLASAPLHFYVHAPARTDPSCCELPTDDAVMVLVPVPPLDERMSAADVSAATERMVARARDAVIQTFESAGMEGFGATIVDERVRTPPGWRDAYGLRRGSVFGLSHNLEQLALARPARRHKGVRGLHWVGANTRPGNGVPLVLIGAMKTAEEALLDLGIGHR